MARRSALGLLLLGGGLRNRRLFVYQSIEISHFTDHTHRHCFISVCIVNYENITAFVFWYMPAVVDKCFLRNLDDLFEQCLFNTRTNSWLESSYLMCTSCTIFSRSGTFIHFENTLMGNCERFCKLMSRKATPGQFIGFYQFIGRSGKMSLTSNPMTMPSCLWQALGSCPWLCPSAASPPPRGRHNGCCREGRPWSRRRRSWDH